MAEIVTFLQRGMVLSLELALSVYFMIGYSRVFGLVQFVEPFSLDYVKTVWFRLVFCMKN